MPIKKSALIFFIASAFVQTAIAQIADTVHLYVNFEEKIIEREMAVYHIKVFKEKPADTDYKREMTDIVEHQLMTTGRSRDPRGLIKQGDFQYFFREGKKWQSGRFEAGKKEGKWEQWYLDGKLNAAWQFHQGNMAGINTGWYNGGNLMDSFALDNTGNGPGTGWYEDGKMRYQGNFSGGLKSGTWKYYYDLPGSHTSMEISFAADSLVSSKCFAENGAPQTRNCVYEREARFAGGDKAWRNYLVDKLSGVDFVKYMKDINLYQVFIKFIVTKDGKLSDIGIEHPRNKKLDKLAETIIRQSPDWEPAMQYNQPVNAYRRQPITFAAE